MKEQRKLLVWLLLAVLITAGIPNFSVKAATSPSVTYSAHIQNYGWLSSVSNGKTAGTVGHGLQVEAVRAKLKNATGSITYSVHVQNKGWMSWEKDNAIGGTTGESLRAEAIKVKLTGTISKTYDVYYRTHIQNIGWTGWSKNGAISGTVEQNLRMEGYQIELVKKGASPKPKEEDGQDLPKAPTPAAPSFGQQVADYACQFLGNEYEYGGTSLTNGCDCSGFVMSVFAHFGISLPRTSVDQRSVGYEVNESDRQPGDIICYDVSGSYKSSHVGIYIGNDQIVNAGSESSGICTRNYNYRHICNIRRVQ